MMMEHPDVKHAILFVKHVLQQQLVLLALLKTIEHSLMVNVFVPVDSIKLLMPIIKYNVENVLLNVNNVQDRTHVWIVMQETID